MAGIILVVVSTASYFGYLILTYLDETITEGEKYGFEIGDTKAEVFEGETIYILHPLDHQNFGPHKKISFNDDEYSFIAGRGRWEFYFNEGFFDSIKLTFSVNQLKKIYKHRKKFELP